MKTKIKICGITSVEEAEYLNQADVEYAGFVFHEKSRRNLTLKQAEKIMKSLDEKIVKVAVTVSPDRILAKQLEDAGFAIIQIHGNMEETVLERIGIPVWRAVNISNMKQVVQKLENLKQQEEKIAGYVVDAVAYGSGQAFAWETFSGNQEADILLERLRKKKFILAGGLNPKNVTEAIRIFSPDIVDVSSGVEGNNGKEQTKINEFVRKVRRHG